MAMRWRWPPENSCGYVEDVARQADAVQQLIRQREPHRGSAPMPWICIGSIRILPTVNRGLSEA